MGVPLAVGRVGRYEVGLRRAGVEGVDVGYIEYHSAKNPAAGAIHRNTSRHRQGANGAPAVHLWEH
jgi:hypothetical protein